MGEKNFNVKETKMIHAIIPLLFLVGSLIYGLKVAEADPHIPIFTSAMVAVVMAVFVLKYKWSFIQKGIIDNINMSMEAILILMVIGMVVGTWMLSGIVPTMIYYGLQIISPAMFLPTALILCSIVSIATGSSWSTAATVGIALMGIGEGLGVPAKITAGAVISGAYFGDKLSPLSDTTNLAPAMAGANLFEHIKHMLYTTIPSYLISLVLFAVIGMKYAGQQLNQESINSFLVTLNETFNVTPVLLIVPVIVLALVIMKVPALPGLFIGAVLGGVAGIVTQGVSTGDVINALHYGYEATTGNEVIDKLLSRGGMDSMMWTVSLILCAMVLGGVMEKTGMLNVIANQILKYASTTGRLILATLITPIFVNTVAGDQYLSIVITGRMFKQAYEDRGLHPKNLSRCLEDSGTILSPLIPWNTCGAYMISALGIAPWVYVPYCFLNLICPIVSAIYGFTGFSIEKTEVPSEETVTV